MECHVGGRRSLAMVNRLPFYAGFDSRVSAPATIRLSVVQFTQVQWSSQRSPRIFTMDLDLAFPNDSLAL